MRGIRGWRELFVWDENVLGRWKNIEQVCFLEEMVKRRAVVDRDFCVKRSLRIGAECLHGMKKDSVRNVTTSSFGGKFDGFRRCEAPLNNPLAPR